MVQENAGPNFNQDFNDLISLNERNFLGKFYLK
jgi:hypothetical protein